jgi:hypothetical protein
MMQTRAERMKFQSQASLTDDDSNGWMHFTSLQTSISNTIQILRLRLRLLVH